MNNLLELQNKLHKYKAKSDGLTIKQHNDSLMNILNQMKSIHDISEDEYNSLYKSIIYHDIGKTSDEFQNNIESTHRRVRHELLSASYNDLNDKERLSVLLHHKTIDKLLQYIDNVYYNEELKELENRLNIETIDIMNFLKKIGRNNRKTTEILNDKELILKLGYLKLCDHIASAGIDSIDVGLYAKDIYNFEKYKSIQEKVLSLNNKDRKDIIIQASTGMGKTETSLLWSDRVQNKDRSKRIFYLLPYTASINALYKRLKKDNISVGVLHSKVNSLLNKEDDIEDIRYELQLFKKNIRQVTICTIFQLIKAIFSCKNFEMIFAQLKDSIIIVDEVHCFDIREFSLLINTLKYLKKEYNVSICIMSASIPSCMLNKIKEELNIETLITSNKDDLLIRHKIHRIDKNIMSDINSIEKDIDNNKKVLICVNNVNSSQEVYTYLKDKYNDKNIKLIHGKFNARDRSEIEQNIDDCDILIGTQAIEVSLDIDFDVLYTEIAPLDSLLQRFGRCNRKGKKGISDIYIYNQINDKSIYNDDILKLTDDVIQEIISVDDGIVYEDKVNYYLDKIYIDFEDNEYLKHSNTFNELIKYIRVGHINENATDNMIGDNNTMTVLPIVLLNEYIELKNKKRSIEANELFVSINKWDKSLVYNEENNIYITNYKYDDRGLIKELEDAFI